MLLVCYYIAYKMLLSDGIMHMQVAYLVDSNPRSKLTSWVTGVILTVDGGHSVRNPLE
jgi:NAD(P)-dependent dehydrogenase (short-subunit alcohol dehydrogenase family)